MIIESYQEAARLEAQPVARHSTAVVGQVFSDGLTLKFPGENGAGQKHYKRFASVAAKTGDKVAVKWNDGTYVITGVLI